MTVSKLTIVKPKRRKHKAKQLIEGAVFLADNTEDIEGYAIVAWSRGGAHTGIVYERGAIPLQLISTMVKETLDDYI
jgi:hypothetical protein